ncbi:MAG TPA: hypothetical protein VGJ57_01935 [Nitrospirales bacterium]|jgi:hypothetical protein
MTRALLAIIFLSALGGCATQPKVQEPNPVITVSCNYPTIAPSPQTKELQGKGGITVSLAPNTFQCSKAVVKTAQNVQPTAGESMSQSMATGGKVQFFKMVEVTSTPVYRVNPDKVAFRVKINNQMPRVFRGAGTVVLYNFGGKNTSVSSKDYAELSNIIVPPRTEAEVTIYGPSFHDIPEKTTLGIFLYDVVIKTDDAGNIVEKQNFEWYYNYQTQVKEDTGEVIKAREWVRR